MIKALKCLLTVAMLVTIFSAPVAATSSTTNDSDWTYYNVQDIFPWPGFEYDFRTLATPAYGFDSWRTTVWGCGQKPGLDLIPGGVACFPMMKE